MLKVSGLSVSFLRYAGIAARRRTVCLRGISLSIASGEMVAIVGESGAGKSLLAHAILGILPANASVEGTATFADALLTPQRQAALRGRQIVLVPQSTGCLDPLTRARRQVEFAAGRAGIRRGAAREAASRTLELFGIGADTARSFPHQLSGGMARRVLLAMACVADPALLLADEPTNGLDDENAGVVLRHLRRLADGGRAVMLISHDLRVAAKTADRIVVVRDGVAVETAPATGFRDTGEALATAYARALWRALPENDFAGQVAIARRI